MSSLKRAVTQAKSCQSAVNDTMVVWYGSVSHLDPVLPFCDMPERLVAFCGDRRYSLRCSRSSKPKEGRKGVELTAIIR